MSKNLTDMVVGVDRDGAVATLEYLAVLKDRVTRGEILPKDVALSIINGYADNLKALLG